MKDRIRQRALELGFDDCRFGPATEPGTAEAFREWLRCGRHGEMRYLARNLEKRVNPLAVLPGARTIISLATAYDVGSSGMASVSGGNQPVAPQGRIARYARGLDYHLVHGRKMETLGRFIQTLGGPPVSSLAYVDTGPILERDLAQRSGLGFVGKHTNLIHRRLGNWFFLAEILTTLELEPDPPEHNRCGSCRRCLDACPTSAFVAPFQLDARRCISYLTIELKGSIPVELRPGIGDRVFGCDDCLEVCPWNRFARRGRQLNAFATGLTGTIDLLGLLSLEEEGFRSRFRETPIWRAKRRGLLRNVCVALGNTADGTALPALERAASDPEPLIAEHAGWAIDAIRARRGS